MRTGNEIDAYLDKDAERVTIEADVDAHGISRLCAWLLSVKRWLKKRQDERDGGTRWEIERPVGEKAAARWMIGKKHFGSVVSLERRGSRKPWKCDACEREQPGGAPCWRQEPRSYAGFSRARFCDDCVQRGGPPGPPKLRIIRGGASNHRKDREV
jgi:hypothetical protein